MLEFSQLHDLRAAMQGIRQHALEEGPVYILMIDIPGPDPDTPMTITTRMGDNEPQFIIQPVLNSLLDAVTTLFDWTETDLFSSNGFLSAFSRISPNGFRQTYYLRGNGPFQLRTEWTVVEPRNAKAVHVFDQELARIKSLLVPKYGIIPDHAVRLLVMQRAAALLGLDEIALLCANEEYLAYLDPYIQELDVETEQFTLGGDS